MFTVFVIIYLTFLHFEFIKWVFEVTLILVSHAVMGWWVTFSNKIFEAPYICLALSLFMSQQFQLANLVREFFGNLKLKWYISCLLDNHKKKIKKIKNKIKNQSIGGFEFTLVDSKIWSNLFIINTPPPPHPPKKKRKEKKKNIKKILHIGFVTTKRKGLAKKD